MSLFSKPRGFSEPASALESSPSRGAGGANRNENKTLKLLIPKITIKEFSETESRLEESSRAGTTKN